MTLLEKFKKDHPNAIMCEYGVPKMCPFHLGYTEEPGCTMFGDYPDVCTPCWNREYKGKYEIIEESTDVADKINDTYVKLREYFDKGESYKIIRGLINGGCFKNGNNT